MFSNTITKNKMAVSVPYVTHETVSLGIELRNFVLTKKFFILVFNKHDSLQYTKQCPKSKLFFSNCNFWQILRSTYFQSCDFTLPKMISWSKLHNLGLFRLGSLYLF